MPRVIIEAMSRALTCFATDVCSLPELLSKDCLFSINDDKKLSNLVLHFSAHKEISINESRNNFEKSKDYSFNVLKKRRNAFLEEFKEYCEKRLINRKKQ